MIQNTHGNRCVTVQKSPVLAQNTELNSEAAAVIVAATAQNLAVVGFRERPVSGELLFARIFGKSHPSAAGQASML